MGVRPLTARAAAVRGDDAAPSPDDRADGERPSVAPSIGGRLADAAGLIGWFVLIDADVVDEARYVGALCVSLAAWTAGTRGRYRSAGRALFVASAAAAAVFAAPAAAGAWVLLMAWYVVAPAPPRGGTMSQGVLETVLRGALAVALLLAPSAALAARWPASHGFSAASSSLIFAHAALVFVWALLLVPLVLTPMSARLDPGGVEGRPGPDGSGVTDRAADDA